MSKRNKNCQAERNRRKSERTLRNRAQGLNYSGEETMDDTMEERGTSSTKKAKRLNRGKHNCPEKDAGGTHALDEQQCLRKGHIGFCGICGIVSSYSYGCAKHKYFGAKKNNLYFERSEELADALAANRASGVLDPLRLPSIEVVYKHGKVASVKDLRADVSDITGYDIYENANYLESLSKMGRNNRQESRGRDG